MRIYVISIILVGLCGPVWTTVYTPCDFARTLYKLLKDRNDLLNEIPLLVCIGGYQQFHTDYVAVNSAESGDHGIQNTFQGIFGLLFEDMTKEFPEVYHRHEDRIRQDLFDFLRKVIHVEDSTSHPNYEFYKTVCSKPHVREVSCRLNDYVLTSYKVFEPLNPDLLDLYRRMPFHTDNQPFLQTEEQTLNHCQSSESYHTHTPIFHPTFLHLLVFWMSGGVIYVVARYTYDYLHFKYLRNIIALG